MDFEEHQRKAAKARWAKAPKGAGSKAIQHASRAYWDAMTPEERSAEMKRRAEVRAKKRAAEKPAGKKRK